MKDTKKFNQYKFHCSSLDRLMTNARKKDELLGETAKAYLREVWIKEVYGREKYLSSPAMRKGTIVESDSLDLLQKVTTNTYFKNQKLLENDYILGTPDVVAPLIDIKSSWDIWTFHSVTENEARKNYYYQLLGYAWLLGVKEAQLIYCLVDTPPEIADHEIFKLTYEMSEAEAEKYRKNYVFGDIPEAQRVKIYNFKFTDDEINELQDRIVEARKYLSSLTIDA